MSLKFGISSICPVSQNSDSAHMLEKKEIFKANTLVLMCYVKEQNVPTVCLALSILGTLYCICIYQVEPHRQTPTSLLCQ